MSKLKNPQDKKFASLTKDRRNVYGENDKSSRKNIARSKQRSHQQARQAVAQVLLRQRGTVAELEDDIESKVSEKTIASKRKRFKKGSDAPLADVLYRRKTGEITPFTGSTVLSKTIAKLRKSD